MTTFSPDDPSIWHYRRKEGEELPPELVAARRESLRRRRPQPQPATVSETRPEHPPISTPYYPQPETPVVRYAEEYRAYLRTRPDWTPGQVSPYVREPHSPAPEIDRSLFNDNMAWASFGPEQDAALERARDDAFARLVRAVEDNAPTEAARHLDACGRTGIKNMRFEHDPVSNRDYLTLELRVPAQSMALRQRLWSLMGRPGPMPGQHWPPEPPQPLREERERPMLRVQVEAPNLAPGYLEMVHRMQERIMTSMVIPPSLFTRIEPA